MAYDDAESKSDNDSPALLACNQKSSRDPQMELTQGEVGSCIRRLQERGLVSGESGSRADFELAEFK